MPVSNLAELLYTTNFLFGMLLAQRVDQHLVQVDVASRVGSALMNVKVKINVKIESVDDSAEEPITVVPPSDNKSSSTRDSHVITPASSCSWKSQSTPNGTITPASMPTRVTPGWSASSGGTPPSQPPESPPPANTTEFDIELNTTTANPNHISESTTKATSAISATLSSSEVWPSRDTPEAASRSTASPESIEPMAEAVISASSSTSSLVTMLAVFCITHFFTLYIFGTSGCAAGATVAADLLNSSDRTQRF
ncbi:unnamed protein product [Nippostrongylus brasiliensis]|uniref:Uncharacterized protein n=1 Tax=Nippostrongylus brasiliensis TaxID=27835 RepID=A0A0N4XWU6_NIPBR|nr:unnamed protein product [Nippostrongylus brasiliensis]